jgi:hypothetical protein
VLGIGAAAPTDDVEPAGINESLERGREAFGGLRVVTILVRQAGIGKA